MRKKLIAFISAALAITVSCSALSVIAAENTEMQTNADMSVSEEKLPETVYEKNVPITDLPDAQELERMYIEKLFYGGGISLYANYGHNLMGTQRELYDFLRAKIEAVARGEITGTVFAVSRSADIPVGSSFQETADELYNAFYADFNVVFQYLLVDLPEDFYWSDKRRSLSFNATSSGNTITAKFNLTFTVASDYMGADNTTVDPQKINAAKTAVANAKKIAAKYDGQSAYDKILGYKKEICDLVSYNHAAADSNSSTVGINPWQLVWVFDGDSSTNVVCEGYSKAFQYLCDLGGIECYTVTGYMNGGGHMWNTVVLDGKSYLVDITNCDGDENSAIVSIGYPDKLLLKGASESSASGCTFDNLGGLTYVYDDDLIYPASILTVSTTDYTPTLSNLFGDVNGDGKFTPKDLTALGKAYMEKTADQYVDVADMDGNGKITPKDIAALGKLYMNRQK